jgi:hypothetical protein
LRRQEAVGNDRTPWVQEAVYENISQAPRRAAGNDGIEERDVAIKHDQRLDGVGGSI